MQAAQFIALDYAGLYPVAPGVVLIKAPGHSPDQQMVYARLQSGPRDPAQRRLGLDLRQHPAGEAEGRAVGEGRRAGDHGAACAGSSTSHDTEPNLTILVTHDDARFDALAKSGLIGELAL